MGAVIGGIEGWGWARGGGVCVGFRSGGPQALSDQPDLINKEPRAGGWIMKLKDAGAVDGLLDEKAYAAFCAAGGH